MKSGHEKVSEGGDVILDVVAARRFSFDRVEMRFGEWDTPLEGVVAEWGLVIRRELVSRVHLELGPYVPLELQCNIVTVYVQLYQGPVKIRNSQLRPTHLAFTDAGRRLDEMMNSWVGDAEEVGSTAFGIDDFQTKCLVDKRQQRWMALVDRRADDGGVQVSVGDDLKPWPASSVHYLHKENVESVRESVDTFNHRRFDHHSKLPIPWRQ